MDAYGLTFWGAGPLPASGARPGNSDEERALAGADEDATVRMKLVDVLASLRMRLKISQRLVARRMGTTQSAVSDMEKGLTDPRLSTLQRHARAIGCRVNVEVVEEHWDASADMDLTFVHYSSWLGTSSPANQSNITSSVRETPARPWRGLLDKDDVARLSEQELAQHIRWSTPYEKLVPQSFNVGHIETRASEK